MTAIVTALDVDARAIGDVPLELAPPVDGPPAAERPDDVGDVGAWIAMTEEKPLANVSRALSLVQRTNATWRTLVTESYSRGPAMLDLTWARALTRPQTELIAAQVSLLQECFYRSWRAKSSGRRGGRGRGQARLGAAALASFCVTAYVGDDVCGDTEPEQADRTALGRVRWLISTEDRDRNDVGDP